MEGIRMAKRLLRKDVENVLSLTPLQKNMLYQYLLDPSGDEYFEQACYQLEGTISKENIINAWKIIIIRFPMLRAVYRWEGLPEPVQIVLKDKKTEIFWEEADGDICVEELLREDKEEKFQLDNGGIRFRFIQQSETKVIMLITNHHILFDGWSNGVLLKEFLQVYKKLQQKEEVVLTCDKCFEDFVYRLQLKSKERQGLDVFKKMFSEYKIHDIAIVKETIKEMRRKEIPLPDTIKKQMLDYVKKSKLTVASFIYTIYAMSVGYIRNEWDININITVSGRSAAIKDIEKSVGLYINVVPFRIQINPDETIETLTRKVRKNLSKVEDYAEYGMHQLTEESGVKLNNNQYSVTIQNYPMDKELFSENSSMKISLMDRSYSSSSDIALGVRAFQNEYMFDYCYNKAAISDDLISQFSESMFLFIAYIVDLSLDETSSVTIREVFERMRSGNSEHLYSKLTGQEIVKLNELEEMIMGELF